MAAGDRAGEALVRAGIITANILERAQARQRESGTSLRAVLIEMGAVTEDEWIEVLSRELGLKTVKEIAGYSFPPDLLGLVDEEFAVRHALFPLKQKDGMLATALTDPFEQETLDYLAKKTGLRIVPFLARRDDIMAAIEKNYRKSAGPAVAKRKILVVDDSQAIVKLIRAALEKEGYEVSAGYDGLEGVRGAVAESPDLIICDTVMPRMDGYGLLRALKANPATAGIPVILLTAKAGSEDEQQALEAGFVDFISKPVQPVRVISRVKRAFELASVKK